MNIYTLKTTFLTVTAVVLAFLSCGTHVIVVDGYISHSNYVKCLPESPEVCIGLEEVSGPMPMYIDGERQMWGVYAWSWQFVEGLEGREGVDDRDVIEEHLNGMVVKVVVDNEGACTIEINHKQCQECFLVDKLYRSTIQYDCTNVENGKMSPEPHDSMKPFLHPFGSDTPTGTPTVAPTPQSVADVDDPDFLWKGKSRKNCVWAGKGKESRVEHKCNRSNGDGKKVYHYCPVACTGKAKP